MAVVGAPDGWADLCAAVRESDPLGVDDLVLSSRGLGLLSVPPTLLLRKVERGSAMVRSGTWEHPTATHAALRDLGFLVTTLRAAAPASLAPGGMHELALLRLGALLDQQPRESVVHYASFNPQGPRRRSFSGSEEEERLICNLADSATAIVGACGSASDLARSPTAAVAALSEIADQLASLSSVASGTGHQLTVKMFVETLRPLWDPLVVAGRPVDGAGPVQLPLYIIDAAIWADADHVTGPYDEYTTHNVSYGLPSWRRQFADLRSSPTVLKRLSELADGDPDGGSLVRACILVLRLMIKFRRHHAGMATRFYRTRLARYPAAVGSSGYRSDIVDLPLRLTEVALAEAQAHADRFKIDLAEGLA